VSEGSERGTRTDVGAIRERITAEPGIADLSRLRHRLARACRIHSGGQANSRT
jgi:hypothetical protein